MRRIVPRNYFLSLCKNSQQSDTYTTHDDGC